MNGIISGMMESLCREEYSEEVSAVVVVGLKWHWRSLNQRQRTACYYQDEVLNNSSLELV